MALNAELDTIHLPGFIRDPTRPVTSDRILEDIKAALFQGSFFEAQSVTLDRSLGGNPTLTLNGMDGRQQVYVWHPDCWEDKHLAIRKHTMVQTNRKNLRRRLEAWKATADEEVSSRLETLIPQIEAHLGLSEGVEEGMRLLQKQFLSPSPGPVDNSSTGVHENPSPPEAEPTEEIVVSEASSSPTKVILFVPSNPRPHTNVWVTRAAFAVSLTLAAASGYLLMNVDQPPVVENIQPNK